MLQFIYLLDYSARLTLAYREQNTMIESRLWDNGNSGYILSEINTWTERSIEKFKLENNSHTKDILRKAEKISEGNNSDKRI